MARLSHGSSFSYSANGTDFTVIAGVKTIDVPSPVFAPVDVTGLDEATTSKQVTPSVLSDPPQITAEAHWDGTVYAAVAALAGATGKTWRVTYENASSDKTVTFSGYLVGVPTVKVGTNNEPLAMTIVVQAMGAFTLA